MGNNAVLGYLMILGGLALTTGGIFVVTRKPQATSTAAAPSPSSSPLVPASAQPTSQPKSLTKDEKGQRFEKWVVKRFSPDYFKIKEWRGDKYVDGIYAESTLNPDLEIEFYMGNIRKSFAVECKWRKSFDKGKKPGIEWATERQIENYRNFSKERGIPVFVVIGVGGEPDNPDELYSIPLEYLKYPYATAEYLANYRLRGTDYFYYDYKVPALR
jgi:hypothetical protein